jgi:phosphoribosylamine---glycine ligase
MKILVVGGGGREHALCWKIARSPLCDRLWCAPGNAGIAEVAESLELDLGDHAAIVARCAELGVDLVVVGPEQPLVDGLSDALRAAGIAAFGPSAAAAQLEGSKSFAKDFMERWGIPTAACVTFDDGDALRAHLADCPLPTVVKADGLAAGKGVIVCTNREEAVAAGEAMAVERRFGAAGTTVVVEEFLAGEEATVFALVDGGTVVALQASQDHKRRFDGDDGPNTGGMGAYTPVPAVHAALMEQVVEEILEPVARGMVAEGSPYQGLLYAGLMLTDEGPQVIEFNVRFGDPECQPLVLAMDFDLLPLLDATARGVLADAPEPSFFGGATLCVVLVSGGYPGPYDKGLTIEGIPADSDDVVVFHAGTRRGADGALLTNGGRVLGVTARGADVAEARAKAYAATEQIAWPGVAWRNDIAHRALGGDR